MIKDNPVPSLEKVVKELYRDHYHIYRRGSFEFPSEDEFVQEQWDLWKLNNLEYFQNGVETE
jgi:hypothetical protein